MKFARNNISVVLDLYILLSSLEKTASIWPCEVTHSCRRTVLHFYRIRLNHFQRIAQHCFCALQLCPLGYSRGQSCSPARRDHEGLMIGRVDKMVLDSCHLVGIRTSQLTGQQLVRSSTICCPIYTSLVCVRGGLLLQNANSIRSILFDLTFNARSHITITENAVVTSGCVDLSPSIKDTSLRIDCRS